MLKSRTAPQAAKLLLGLIVIISVGCGKAPSIRESADVPASAPSETAHESPAIALPQAEIDISVPAKLADVNVVEPGDPPPADQPVVSLIETAASPATSIAPPPVPTPTAEQIARWKQPEVEPLQLLARHHFDQLTFLSCSAASEGGKSFVLGGAKLTLWKQGSTDPPATLWEFVNLSNPTSIKSVALAPNGQWVAAGDTTGLLRIWNLADQKEMASKKIYNNDVVQIAISDDSQEIATSTYGKEVSVWNAANVELKNEFSTDGNSKLCYMGPNKLIVAGEAMTVWNTSTGKQEETIFEKGYSESVARSKSGTWVSAASDDAVRLIHSSDASLNRSWMGSFARNELQEFADDKLLWTANGATIRAWDIEHGRVLQVIDTHGPGIVGLNWLADERLLRVITEDGTLKIWGTVAAGEALGLKPLHDPVTLPEPTQVEPTTSTQLLATIDLRSLPRPPQSNATVGESAMVQFETSATIDEVKSFYRYLLPQRGWTEQAGNQFTPDYLDFDKHGFRLFISVSSSSPASTAVQLVSLGNVSAQSIPKLDFVPIKVVYEDKSSALYRIKSDLLAIEVRLLKRLFAAGWIPYARLNSSHSEDAEKRDLEFIRNAMTLRVSVSPSIDDPSVFDVQYTTFVAESNLPVPNDCDYIECDAGRLPALVAFTSLSMDKCQGFYNQAMLNQGWLAAETRHSPKDSKEEVSWLTYYQGQKELTLRLSRNEDGRTLVLVGEYARKNSWQLAEHKPSRTSDNEAAKTEVALEAADIPIYKGSEAKSVKYDTKFRTIEVEIPKTSHIEIVDYYAKTFGDLGWKEEPNGFRAEDYAFVTFKQGKASIQIRVNSTPTLNKTSYSLSDDGVHWTKALPERRELISYETWLRKKHHPATLRLLEQYAADMVTK